VYYKPDEEKVQYKCKEWFGVKIPPENCTTIWYNGITTNLFNEMVISDDFKDFSPEPVLDKSSLTNMVQTPKKSNVSSNVLSKVSDTC
jgi:hypothetical protein